MIKEATPKAVNLKDYQPPAFNISKVDLHFDIRDGATVVSNRMAVTRAPGVSADAPLVLDGRDLELLEVSVDGAPVGDNRQRLEDDKLLLLGLPEQAEVTVVTRIHPEDNTALEGLYKSGGMYCTQCEAEGFRRITYYPDRPDVLSCFTTTIAADGGRYPVLLSNGNPVAERQLEDGRREVTWEDPFPKPSYLFALVAGDLALLEDTFVTGSGRRVALRIYSEPHNIGQCDYAMDVLKRSMRWDEEVFGREYDLDIFMIVAVDDFNMGAMENKGLNIFNTSCVLASPDTATDAAYLRVEAVVAHEYFHNWSGNRVTCRDWFQLSLKEGFTVFRDAEFSSDMNSRTVKRIEDVVRLRSVQFPEDAGPLAHPVRPASYIEISNFYTPTVYEKGAEVVRMLHTLIGAERFRAGSDLYFARHDGAAVTTEDFVAAMAEAGAVDLGQFQRWYDQAGTPLLDVTESFADGELRLTIAQSCPPTPGQPHKAPFHIPLLLGLLAADGRDITADVEVTCADAVERRPEGLLLHLRSQDVTLSVRGLAERPRLSFLRAFSAPVRVRYPRPAADLGFLVAHDADGFARWDALQTLVVDEVTQLQDGGSPSTHLIDVFGALLEHALAAPERAEDRFMLAAMLTLADESYLLQQYDVADVDRVCNARDALVKALATAHRDGWQALYEANAPTGSFDPGALAMARRSLRRAALALLVPGLDGGAAEALLAAQYRQADNLTDRHAALQQAVQHPAVDRAASARLLDDFYHRWQHEALVVNTWFSLQAASPLLGAEAMGELVGHPAFDARNPNKLRSVYAVFARFNHRNFHRRDGSGYQFLSDAVLDVDRRNPSMAASMAIPLTRWRRFDPERARLMRGVLNRMAAEPELSKDLYEVVAKSLSETDQS